MDLARLEALANAIPNGPARRYALEQVRVTKDQEARLTSVQTALLALASGGSRVRSPFAFAWGASQPTAQYCREMRAAGAEWVRFEVEWTNIEPTTKGTFSGWAAYDTAVLAAEAAGLKVLPILSTTPTWARVSGTPPYSGSVWWRPPTNASDYADFCAAVVARYKPGGTIGANVDAYEIWNEPNYGDVFWGGFAADATKYASMLSAAYDAIKAAQPGATVVTAGLAPYGSFGEGNVARVNPLTYLNGIFSAGAGSKFDAIGWHPYGATGFADNETWSAWWQMHGSTPSVRSILAANGRSSAPIWITEYGDSITPGWGGRPVETPLSEATVAARVTEAYQRRAALTYPVGPLFYFCYRNSIGDAAGFSAVDPSTGTQRARYTAFEAAAP